MAPDRISLQAAREHAIDTLCGRFADDTLSMAELERRLETARRAHTREELRSLLSDLPAPVPAAPDASAVRARVGGREPDHRTGRGDRSGSERPGSDGLTEGKVRSSGSVAMAVMGGTRRAGKWAPPSEMLAFAVMGGVELDFRDAVLQPGSVTTINCFAFWGGIDITVPPEVHVDTRGFALLGGFDQSGVAWEEPPEGAPTLVVNGFALMGGVDVKIKERGQVRSRSRSRGELRRGRDEES
jgi:hypothetical protein